MSIFSSLWHWIKGPKPEKGITSAEVHKADRIIRLTKRRIEEAKARGETSVSIMTLSPTNFDWSNVMGLNNPTPDDLEGAARIVYSVAAAKGWNPRLFHWWKTSGGYSGYELMIHWGEIPDYPDETLV